MERQDQPAEADAAELPVLSSPAEPVGDVVATPQALSDAVDRLARGTGPTAVDAERAQSYRYSSQAYLIQLRRPGAGTVLVDPIAFAPDDGVADLSDLAHSIASDEWIIHAASQDIPCLAQIGMVPRQLFDTELAGRLLGQPRVALGTLIELYFGVRLLKEHSAADWSTRPLPDEWLTYAALDVELLPELRDLLAADLRAFGKEEWAQQEFAWLAEQARVRPAPRVDPWRRTSGIHAVRSTVGMAIVRELFQTRDALARRLDKAPGRILPDRAITEIATHAKPGRGQLRSVQGFQRRTARRHESDWLDALERAQALPRAQLPPQHLPPDGPPPPRSWQQRDAAAYARYLALRHAITDLAEQHRLPAENLLTPDVWRRLAWQPPAEVNVETVDEFVRLSQARQWQRDLTVPRLTAALRRQPID